MYLAGGKKVREEPKHWNAIPGSRIGALKLVCHPCGAGAEKRFTVPRTRSSRDVRTAGMASIAPRSYRSVSAWWVAVAGLTAASKGQRVRSEHTWRDRLDVMREGRRSSESGGGR